MPTSNHSTKKMTTLTVFSALLTCFIMAIWASQHSVNAYIEQTYHRDSPLNALNQYPLWTKGGELQTKLYQWRDQINQNIDDNNQQIVENFNQHHAFTQTYKEQLAKVERQAKEKSKKQSINNTSDITTPQPTIAVANTIRNDNNRHLSNNITLTTTGQVFFAGDSMMQGVAPHLQHRLQHRHAIKSINLSKQSTGLAYTKLFDWVNTIKNTINQNPNIKLLVVFLGPNDLWDIPNPKTGKYTRFGSKEWAEVYSGRIESIIKHAHSKKVQVIWLGPPTMQKADLNKHMIWLNDVIAKEVNKNNSLFIDTRPLLGGRDNRYKETLLHQGKNVKIRTTDGIHFTPAGQKIIAEAVWQHIHIE